MTLAFTLLLDKMVVGTIKMISLAEAYWMQQIPCRYGLHVLLGA